MLKSIVLSATLLLSLGVAAAQAQSNGIDPAAKARDSDPRRPANAEQPPVNIDKVPRRSATRLTARR